MSNDVERCEVPDADGVSCGSTTSVRRCAVGAETLLVCGACRRDLHNVEVIGS